MNNSVKVELKSHILDLIKDGVLTNDNQEEWHFYAFNENYYCIGYYQCSEWMKNHDIEQFEGAGICTEYEIENFGECVEVYNDSEKVVNMLAYIWGEELLCEINAKNIKQLKKACKN